MLKKIRAAFFRLLFETLGSLFVLLSGLVVAVLLPIIAVLIVVLIDNYRQGCP